MLLKLVSWNVNGLRAVAGKEAWDWFRRTDAQVVALQETKAHPDQLDEDLRRPEGWEAHWASSTVKKGYSGVAVFSRLAPQRVSVELPQPEFQGEGRLLHLEFPHFHFFNGYFPNGGAEELDENGKPTGRFKRLPYKMGFFEAFFAYAEACRKSTPIVVGGEFNIAHKAVDLARPNKTSNARAFCPKSAPCWTASRPWAMWTPSAMCTARSRGTIPGGPTNPARGKTPWAGASTTFLFRRSLPRPCATPG